MFWLTLPFSRYPELHVVIIIAQDQCSWPWFPKREDRYLIGFSVPGFYPKPERADLTLQDLFQIVTWPVASLVRGKQPQTKARMSVYMGSLRIIKFQSYWINTPNVLSGPCTSLYPCRMTGWSGIPYSIGFTGMCISSRDNQGRQTCPLQDMPWSTNWDSL